MTSEDERVTFTEQLSEAEDWLYGDGEAADAAAFKDKLTQLEKVGLPIAVRANEQEIRPEVGQVCSFIVDCCCLAQTDTSPVADLVPVGCATAYFSMIGT